MGVHADAHAHADADGVDAAHGDGVDADYLMLRCGSALGDHRQLLFAHCKTCLPPCTGQPSPGCAMARLGCVQTLFNVLLTVLRVICIHHLCMPVPVLMAYLLNV